MPWDASLSKVAEPTLNVVEQQREYADKQQVVNAGVEQRPCDAVGLHERFARLGKLDDGDDARKRGVLHEGDDLIAHGRDDALYHLKQRDLEEDLRLCHAEDFTGLALSLRDALNAAAVDDGEVAGIVYHKRHGAGKQTLCAPYVLAEPKAGAVIDNDELKHERRAADDPDDYIRQRAYRAECSKPRRALGKARKRRPFAHRAESDHKPQREREKQRQRKELRRRAETCEQAHGYSPKHEDSP